MQGQYPQVIFRHQDYLVNNSFHSGIQPKRISFDMTLYSIVQKKVLRQAMIEEKFKDSATSFKHSSESLQKGFKGKALPSFFIVPKKPKQIHFTQMNERERQLSYPIASQNPLNKAVEQRKTWGSHQTFISRPNMMRNLDLYRRGFRKKLPQSRNRLKTSEKTNEECLRCERDRMRTVT